MPTTLLADICRQLSRELGALALLGLLCASPSAAAAPQPPAAAQKLARAVFQELCEIDTTQSRGDTHKAARAMAAHLRAAGFAAADVRVFETGKKRGNLVARLRGSGKKKPLLLLAHLDVVEAKREDWSTDPFKLVEKDGFLYARGTADDKYMAAVFVVNLIRYKQEGARFDRDIIVALTADEEISDRHHYGINWLLEHQRPLIDAELALNEGGGVAVKNGKPAWNSLQTTEKAYQSFWLQTKNSGGHSSLPRADNAVYELAAGLTRVAAFRFPLLLNETTRVYF